MGECFTHTHTHTYIDFDCIKIHCQLMIASMSALSATKLCHNHITAIVYLQRNALLCRAFIVGEGVEGEVK